MVSTAWPTSASTLPPTSDQPTGCRWSVSPRRTRGPAWPWPARLTGEGRELAQLAFVREAANVLFLGPPGVGKTQLALALALQAIEAGYGWLAPGRPHGGPKRMRTSAVAKWRVEAALAVESLPGPWSGCRSARAGEQD